MDRDTTIAMKKRIDYWADQLNTGSEQAPGEPMRCIGNEKLAALAQELLPDCHLKVQRASNELKQGAKTELFDSQGNRLAYEKTQIRMAHRIVGIALHRLATAPVDATTGTLVDRDRIAELKARATADIEDVLLRLGEATGMTVAVACSGLDIKLELHLKI